VSRKDKSLGDVRMISFGLKFYSRGENMTCGYLIIAGKYHARKGRNTKCLEK